jgi:hypothetical protein
LKHAFVTAVLNRADLGIIIYIIFISVICATAGKLTTYSDGNLKSSDDKAYPFVRQFWIEKLKKIFYLYGP